MLPHQTQPQQPQNEEVFPLEKLEDGQLYYLLKFLDNHSLTAIAQVNKKYRTLANQILDQRLEDRIAHITTLYEQLPTETKALLPLEPITQDIPRFMALAPFMQTQFSHRPTQRNLTPAELNQVAVGCYWINHQMKHPMAPLPELPTFDEAQLMSNARQEMRMKIRCCLQLGPMIFANFTAFNDIKTVFSPEDQNARHVFHISMATLTVIISGLLMLTHFTMATKHVSPLRNKYNGTLLAEHPPYKAWIDLVLREVEQAEGNLLPRLCRIAKTRKFFTHVDHFSLALTFPAHLYACCFLLAPVSMAFTPFLPAILYFRSELHNQSNRSKILKGAALSSMMCTIYGLTFYFFYQNQDMKDRMDTLVYTDRQYMRICFTSLIAAAAVFVATGLFHTARYAVHTAHTWRPSQRPAQALIPDDDLELGIVAVPPVPM